MHVEPEVAEPHHAPVVLTVVIPTYNERGNVLELLVRLEATLENIPWEAVFVDDHSPDGTAELLRSAAQKDSRVRVIERIGRRGLSSACIEGMMSSSAPYIAVIDADLQHDESILPRMLRLIENEAADVVIGSRNCNGGSMGKFTRGREMLSHLGRKVSKLVCRCDISDAMSGFFMIEARFFRAQVPRLTGSGFKILVDILASSKHTPRVFEVPYHFRMRTCGESKLDINVQLEYLFLIADKIIGCWVPTRFVLFTAVGALGVGVYLAVLAVLYKSGVASFMRAQVAATVVAMTSNFLLNNIATFRSQKLHGVRLLTGLLRFYVACSLGALINIAFAGMLIRHGLPWLLAGGLGLTVSSVWNYWINTVLTWRRRVCRA